MIEWAKDLPWPFIAAYAEEFGIESNLIAAIIMTESSGLPLISRYEPHYQWLFAPERFAGRLGQTKETEVIQQKTSYGLMQIMGATARELGHETYLPELYDIETNLEFGCKYLKKQLTRYKSVKSAIAAYNAGSLRTNKEGQIVNQAYIDKVVGFLKELQLQPK